LIAQSPIMFGAALTFALGRITSALSRWAERDPELVEGEREEPVGSSAWLGRVL
jgi:hypothetical protein